LFTKCLKKRSKITLVISILVIISVLILSIFTDLFSIRDNKSVKYTEEENIEYELDNRISPLTNQGLILEINRIRHRGLIDKIMKNGFSWRYPPQFYVITNIDDQEYSSYNEYGFTFKTWDTISQEFRIIKDVEEELKTSEIAITIVEKGFIGLKNIEKEKLQLTYDYLTGRWTGDDDISDEDGYGHYIGETFEVWFNLYQTDYDHDGIPYWTEVNVLHTNPCVDDSKQDVDEDGVPTNWEWKWGYDPNIWDDHENLDPDIDGIENIEEYQMDKWFANPFSQDIYLEVDGMQKGGLFDNDHVLFEESQQIIIERFCQHGINVYIDNGWPGGPVNGGGELLPHIKRISWDSGMMLQYYNHYFPDDRRGIFRYLLMCHSGVFPMNAFSGNTEFNRFDTMAVGLHLYQKLLTPRTQRLLVAATVLHELGHTLSIAPYTIEGCDNISLFDIREIRQYIEEWGNYKSVMNYLYVGSKKIIDFSDGTHGYNDQNDWEKFYLPFFQIENNIICEPGILPPATDKVVDENLSITLKGWEYNKAVTQKYSEDISGWSPVDPIKCNWSVYIKTEDNSFPSDRNLRIYCWPMVPISGWSLIKEGYWISSTNNIKV
jgi:hypothetical protein